MAFTPEARSVLATVVALNDYKARKHEVAPHATGGEKPAPDDGEDDEIPNEPKDKA